VIVTCPTLVGVHRWAGCLPKEYLAGFSPENSQRKVVFGTLTAAAKLIRQRDGGSGINTSFIERFNAPLRERLGSLTRKCCRAAHQTETLHYRMYLVDCLAG
jgi:hypothetical protein